MMLSMAVQIILGVIYFGSVAAFNAFSGVGVIFLTVSYACPIAVSLLGGRKHIQDGQFNLGVIGLVCNVIALGKCFQRIRKLGVDFFDSAADSRFTAWSILAVPLFCMPSYLPVTASLMNYASVVFVGFVLIASGWYFVWGHKNYAGPPTQDDEILQERRRSIQGQ